MRNKKGGLMHQSDRLLWGKVGTTTKSEGGSILKKLNYRRLKMLKNMVPL